MKAFLLVLICLLISVYAEHALKITCTPLTSNSKKVHVSVTVPAGTNPSGISLVTKNIELHDHANVKVSSDNFSESDTIDFSDDTPTTLEYEVAEEEGDQDVLQEEVVMNFDFDIKSIADNAEDVQFDVEVTDQNDQVITGELVEPIRSPLSNYVHVDTEALEDMTNQFTIDLKNIQNTFATLKFQLHNAAYKFVATEDPMCVVKIADQLHDLVADVVENELTVHFDNEAQVQVGDDIRFQCPDVVLQADEGAQEHGILMSVEDVDEKHIITGHFVAEASNNVAIGVLDNDKPSAAKIALFSVISLAALATISFAVYAVFRKVNPKSEALLDDDVMSFYQPPEIHIEDPLQSETIEEQFV